MDRYDNRGRIKFDPKHHGRSGHPYTESDLVAICTMHYLGKKHTQIGLAVGRTAGAISNKICYLIQHGLYAEYLQNGGDYDV